MAVTEAALNRVTVLVRFCSVNALQCC